MLPLAPGRLSTMNCCLSDSPSACPRILAKTSVPPPGDEGTINLTGFAGQVSCAGAGSEAMRSEKIRRMRVMRASYIHVHSMRIGSGEEVLIARVLAENGAGGFGFTFRLDATEARHMAEWAAGVREQRPAYDSVLGHPWEKAFLRKEAIPW